MLESVPNVSEGRDRVLIAELGDAFRRAGARLLDVHADADHHRAVFTLVGEPADLVRALVAGAALARERIDLRRHDGVHPRVGAIDVVPLVPLLPGDMPDAMEAALNVAGSLGEDLAIPVFLYGEVGGGRRPVFVRRGGLEELARRVAARDIVPDYGPSRLEPRTGATLVGARPPLVAYNLDIATDDLGVARRVAAAVRESGGGLPGVQAIGLRLPRSRRVQVSMNVLDLERSPLHEVVARVRDEAAKLDVEVVNGELVGLVPETALVAADAAGVSIPGVDGSRVLERRLAAPL